PVRAAPSAVLVVVRREEEVTFAGVADGGAGRIDRHPGGVRVGLDVVLVGVVGFVEVDLVEGGQCLGQVVVLQAQQFTILLGGERVGDGVGQIGRGLGDAV